MEKVQLLFNRWWLPTSEKKKKKRRMITIQLQVLCCCNCSVCLILFLCASGPCLPTLPAIPPNPHPGMHPSRIKSPSHQTTNFHISPRCCVNTPVVCFFAGEYKHFVIYQELFSSCAFVILVIFFFWGGVHLFVIAFYYAVEDYSEEKQIYVLLLSRFTLNQQQRTNLEKATVSSTVLYAV